MNRSLPKAIIKGFERTEAILDGVRITYEIGGSGPPLLLLHGYPQTHAMWHKVAPQLARDYTVITPDLRGYGDSDKPDAGKDHGGYAKRVMARDQVRLMDRLGFERFYVAGHDRGARVTHRLALDHSHRVIKAAVMDIVPTLTVFETTDQALATAYYHWFFLIQGDGLPEKLIGADPEAYLMAKLGHWSRDGFKFDAKALKEYKRCFGTETIHASCEDYRAAASIDLVHDRADRRTKLSVPLLVLWGAHGAMARIYDVLATWEEKATDVRGMPVDSGHFLPEEAPEQTVSALRGFFTG
ncbi:MAG: alpha/beta fold hydrolase [Magnetovibrionaceae bacterium]